MRLTIQAAWSICSIYALTLAAPEAVLAQEEKTAKVSQAEAEMKEAFGTLPSWLMAYPANARAAAWEWNKAIEGPGVIPPKYQQLIALAVASQIPCEYCTFVHREFATGFFGASKAEISEAVALAANVRHWSTILYGNGINKEDFRTEIREIITYMKSQSEASNGETKEDQ